MAGPRRRIVILGAAGRDFHDFNVAFRDDPAVEVVAFTAAQIPGIGGRRYPAALAGPLYPDGISILDETELDALCARERVAEVVFAYSDVTHERVMHLASRALAAGADFTLLGPARTMLAAPVPVIAVSAVRTGCGKSQTARWLAGRLRARGLAPVVIRHPMPYGELARQAVQRFESRADLDEAACTVEEREEYEPHLAAGNVVYAGVDYAPIVAAAAREADLLVWDGGNNDFPFLRPDLHVVLVDALRPLDTATHHPGEAVLRMADLVVVAKADAAAPVQLREAIAAVRALRPDVPIVRTGSPVRLDDATAVRGRRVVVVDDGPTLTHGGMPYGAGYVAAVEAGATIVDPRPWAAPALAAAYAAYPHLGHVVPALGYSPAQLEALRSTLDAVDADAIVSGTPADLATLIPLRKPVVRARYELADLDANGLGAHLDAFLARVGLVR
jgi:predicted GTPase